jgi:spermidine synthase
MALVWQKESDGRLYEVRSAGRSLRLYTDGVCHSQYNATSPLTGQVWDLLMLPAFFHEPGAISRVLVLGVGGGASIHLLRHFVGPETIVGVELNPVHIYVARRFFKLKHDSIKLVHADAIQWINDYKGEKFDLIIDDLFAEENGEPVPAVESNAGWFNRLLKHVKKDGMIVKNFLDMPSARSSAGLASPGVNQKFSSIFQLTTPYNENVAVAYLKRPSTSEALRKHLAATPGLNPALKSTRLRYRAYRLK